MELSIKRFLSRLFRWEKGRQNTGYDKMLVGAGFWPNPFDVYLLRFREGQGIPPHVDQVNSGEHYRFNLVLKQPKSGGHFRCSNPIFESSRIKLFRSDISEHSVTPVKQGSRYVLSIGWVKNT
ncbi:2OG-Fe(II) oxygenase [Marinobacter halodurans]|uniref:2OG-Fe(II) oxygenase n=2 Tax=Pseudomonadota TaxID=1224 RepID=A0ABY1ZDY9_9GAMM|nr:2OG-Fe(II) oxygenase [Marinobacter halodurans]